MKKLKLLKFLTLDRDRSTTRIANSTAWLGWTLRYAQWVLLLMVILLYVGTAVAIGTAAALPKVIAFNLVLFLFSFIFPLDRPRWQRYTYVALEISIVLVAQALLGTDVTVLLYFFLIKSCFLLSRRDVLFTVAIAGLGYLISLTYHLPRFVQEQLEQARSGFFERLSADVLVQTMFAQYSVSYLCISIFVILIGFIVTSERKSRQRAEALTKEVQTLVATLERTRIARDIHDSLGHTLTTLGVQLEVAQKLRQRDPKQALQAVDTAKLLADQCLEDVRRALQSMRQNDFNFDQALMTLLDRVKCSQSFTITTEVNLPSLPLETNQQLYSIVQEGLTNIQKYANASQVSLRLWATPDSIHLILKDDGRGFDTTRVYSGFGLRGMKERVQILGGEIKIISSLGQGTQIRVSIPQ
jgi:signal transduction histidine kinase